MALVVLTGGARSGKSAAAQRLAQTRASEGVPVTVAVFGRAGDDPEMLDRIARHKAERPAGFDTLECEQSGGWIDRVPEGALLVVDCLGTLLGLAMDEAFAACDAGEVQVADAATLPGGLEAALSERFWPAVRAIAERAGDTIVVTNEVGLSVVPEWASARLFRDELGRANRALVAASDAAYLVVAGRAIDLLAAPAHVRWPED